MDNDDDSYPFGSGGEDDAPDESSESEDDEDTFDDIVRRIEENDPLTRELNGYGHNGIIQNMTDDEWAELGENIANNTKLENVFLNKGALNDHKMSFFFRGLTRSTSIKDMRLTESENGLSVEGIRSMVPFLQNTNCLKQLHLDNNTIQSEGFNIVFQALRDSPVERLSCRGCGIESIEIDNDHIPPCVKYLDFYGNNLNADGCRGLAKLLRGGNSTMKILGLGNNKIDDAGVAILVDALQSNSSLENLDLRGNDGISIQGQIMLLRLVNDVSSIPATLQSNQTLTYLCVHGLFEADKEIQTHIDMATRINMSYGSNPESAGREKLIQTQLSSVKRAELAHLQGVNRSLYSEINPLHLPEVLSLIGRRHGQGEVFVALRASIIGLFSTVNMKQFIQQERKYHEAKIAEHRAKIEELDAKLVTMDEAAGRNQDDMEESHSNKRRRT